MGLLDALFTGGGSGGGLLDFLKNNALNQPMPGMPQGDAAQYGQMAQAPQMQAPQMGAVPQQPPPVIQAQPMQQPQAPAEGPGIGDRLMSGLQGLAAPSSGGLIGHLAGAIGGLSGQPTAANLTAKALLAKGVDPVAVQAAIANPELLKTLITQVYGPQTVTSLGDGYVTDKNGKVTRAYTPEQKDNFAVVQTGEDGLGHKTFAKMNKATGEETPLESKSGDTGSSGLGDMNKTGAEYLATVPKQQQGVLQGMVDGTIQPPSSFALAKPYWQSMLAAAKNLDPTFDANTWATRHKMSTDMGASGNSSMGGILSNGKSAFSHLSDLSKSMADLGNASHDYPGGGTVAAVQNYTNNKMLAGSDTLAKIKAINDNLGHYGQESTKFYSGTGGGVEERMNALKEMNPTTTSSEEMASYIEKEKGLMTERLKQKEAQIKDTMGEAYLQKHPVMTDDLKQTIATIDGNIAKLKGASPAAPSAKPLPKPGDMQGGYRFKGGNPADKANWEPAA